MNDVTFAIFGFLGRFGFSLASLRLAFSSFVVLPPVCVGLRPIAVRLFAFPFLPSGRVVVGSCRRRFASVGVEEEISKTLTHLFL